MIRSELGLGPWDAFHVGLSLHTPLSIGVASIATGVLVLAVALALRMRPGPGTIANMVLIGVFTDLLLPVVPPARGILWGLGYFIPAVAILGLCTGMYIAAQLGPGPRDGLMLAITRRTGWSVRVVRTAIELSALGAGWLMGGAVGVGTLIFALLVGPTAQWGLGVFGIPGGDSPPRGGRPARDEADGTGMANGVAEGHAAA